MIISLFPVEDLLHTLDTGVSNYMLQPSLYSRDVIVYYYPSLETTLSTDAVVPEHIPFKSSDTFEAYQLE